MTNNFSFESSFDSYKKQFGLDDNTAFQQLLNKTKGDVARENALRSSYARYTAAKKSTPATTTATVPASPVSVPETPRSVMTQDTTPPASLGNIKDTASNVAISNEARTAMEKSQEKLKNVSEYSSFKDEMAKMLADGVNPLIQKQLDAVESMRKSVDDFKNSRKLIDDQKKLDEETFARQEGALVAELQRKTAGYSDPGVRAATRAFTTSADRAAQKSAINKNYLTSIKDYAANLNSLETSIINATEIPLENKKALLERIASEKDAARKLVLEVKQEGVGEKYKPLQDALSQKSEIAWKEALTNADMNSYLTADSTNRKNKLWTKMYSSAGDGLRDYLTEEDFNEAVKRGTLVDALAYLTSEAKKRQAAGQTTSKLPTLPSSTTTESGVGEGSKTSSGTTTIGKKVDTSGKVDLIQAARDTLSFKDNPQQGREYLNQYSTTEQQQILEIASQLKKSEAGKTASTQKDTASNTDSISSVVKGIGSYFESSERGGRFEWYFENMLLANQADVKSNISRLGDIPKTTLVKFVNAIKESDPGFTKVYDALLKSDISKEAIKLELIKMYRGEPNIFLMPRPDDSYLEKFIKKSEAGKTASTSDSSNMFGADVFRAGNIRAILHQLRSKEGVEMAKKYRQEKGNIPREDLNTFMRAAFNSNQAFKDNLALLRKVLPADVLYVELSKKYRNEPSLFDQDVTQYIDEDLY